MHVHYLNGVLWYPFGQVVLIFVGGNTQISYNNSWNHLATRYSSLFLGTLLSPGETEHPVVVMLPVHVKAWVAMVFGINSTSNAARKGVK